MWLGLGSLGVLLLLGSTGLYWLSRSSRSRPWERYADLRAVQWQGADLSGADLSQQILREADLSRANLSQANLREADFSGATYLDEANLQKADLTEAKLQATFARQTNFTGAILRDAEMQFANLSGANLSQADLAGANLENANLTAADLSDWIHPPAYLDGANLTDAKGEITKLPGTRLCNTILPSGIVSKQGCYWPSANLKQAWQLQDWRWAEEATSALFQEAFYQAGNSDPIPHDQKTAEQLTNDIKNIPCQDLQELDRQWREVSRDRISFSLQRQIWESPTVKQDYSKFADVVGWKQQGKWLKRDELLSNKKKVEEIPPGYLPWHGWQVQEPTQDEPTRFRRRAFGAWMHHLKQCNI